MIKMAYVNPEYAEETNVINSWEVGEPILYEEIKRYLGKDNGSFEIEIDDYYPFKFELIAYNDSAYKSLLKFKERCSRFNLSVSRCDLDKD